MSPWKFVLYGALPATVAVQTALAGQVVEVVTLKLRAGVAAAEFAPIADASMASFQKAPAAAQYMLRIEASTMSMKRDQG